MWPNPSIAVRARRGRPRCIYLEGIRSHNEACIDSRVLSSTVASQCQTLRELLAGETHTDSPAHQLAVWRMRSSSRVCTLVQPSARMRSEGYSSRSVCLRVLALQATRRPMSGRERQCSITVHMRRGCGRAFHLVKRQYVASIETQKSRWIE